MHRRRIPALVACGVLGAACDSTDPSNAAPAAGFTVACDRLQCAFENSSTDPDGTVMALAWEFGDGGGSKERNPMHAYAAPGDFTVILTVTDEDGAASAASRQVRVRQESGAPLADFAVACTSFTCRFTDRSTDPGGSVVSHAWDFGDGGTSAEADPSHTYASPGGQFAVTLAVTDNEGTTETATKQVTVPTGSPGWTGTYERETPHDAPGHHSRYVFRQDGRFELYDEKGSDTTVYTGRWVFPTSYGGWGLEPGAVIVLDFDGYQQSDACGGEGFGSFLPDGHLGIAYCWMMIEAGLEEGVYASAPASPLVPPPQDGQIAFVRNGRIHRVNTDGSGLVQLSDGPHDRTPAWSPDGSRIAFTRTHGGTTGVFIMDADGSNVVRRTASGADPTWSPDGQWIAFACSQGICKVRADDDTAPVEVYGQGIGRVEYPAWSPDGDRIAFTSDWAMFDIWLDIWLVAPDGSHATALRDHTPQVPHAGEQYQAAWSPDGRRLAHVECPWAFSSCSSSVIAVMNADGSGLTRLAAASGFASPTWSPDGQVIAFASANVIEWVSPDGSQRGRIIRDGHSPTWRP